ncbi:MAG: hypothetical protein QXU54_01700 [Candidatus Micrarchaeia archaeon]
MRGIAFVLALILIILLGGCVTPPQNDGTTTEEPVAEENQTGTGAGEANITKNITVGPCTALTRTEVDACLLSEGLCSEIADSGLRDECYLGRLECEEISDDGIRNECNEKALNARCASAGDAGLCKALATGDYRHCGDNVGCLIGFANATKNSSACSLIGDYNAVACRAIVEGNYMLCYTELEYDALHKECIRQYSRVTGKDSEICEGISLSRYKDECYAAVAASSGHYSLCAKILYYPERKACYTSAAMERGIIEPCLEIAETFTHDPYKDRDYCISIVAQKYYKPHYCEKIVVSGRLACFNNAIVKGKVKKEDCALINAAEYPEQAALCYQSAGQ